MLPRDRRISTELFKTLLGKGRVFGLGAFSVRVVGSQDKKSRISVVVSKKTAGLAVDRNRIKRRVYETVRLLISDIKPGFLVAIFPKTNVREMKSHELKQNIKELFSKAGLV